MNEFEEKLKAFIRNNNIHCEYFHFKQSCHSVEDAAKAVKAKIDDFVKNICLIDSQGNLIIALVKGENRASTSRVAKALSIERPRIATPKEILGKTGYPCGGVPSFGFQAIFLIDPRVLEKELVYTSGGSQKSLIKISPKELQKANKGQLLRIRK